MRIRICVFLYVYVENGTPTISQYDESMEIREIDRKLCSCNHWKHLFVEHRTKVYI